VDFLPDSGEDSRCESGAFDDEAEPLENDFLSGALTKAGLLSAKR